MIPKWLLLAIIVSFALPIHAAPLPAKIAFPVQIQQLDSQTLSLNWQIQPGYFLYKDRITLTLSPESPVQLKKLTFPEALEKHDSQGTTYLIYKNKLSLPFAIQGTQSLRSSIELHFQGCSDAGFCYPPQTKWIHFTLNQAGALTHFEIKSDAISPEVQTANNPMANIFNHHWIISMLIFLSLGVLLAFTPCILPMVPVLSGIIVGHGKHITTRKAFFLSLSYVFSMSVTYAFVGALVAFMGRNLQISMQSPWAISIFSCMFILLSLSMFGFYELSLPNTWQAKLSSRYAKNSAGLYLGAALMGCLSTLILSPCVTAPLLGVLGYIATTGNLSLGILALFCVGLGMGLPLLLIGTAAGKWLPVAGSWMLIIKDIFGIILLGMALFLLSRILPETLIMALFAIFLLFTGWYCGAFQAVKDPFEKFRKSLGLLFFTYGLLVLTGASLGKTHLLWPLSYLQSTKAASLPMQTVHSFGGLQKALQNAKGKPVMVDFYAKWCASCNIMAKTTFTDVQVHEALQDFVLIKVDITANTADHQAILQHFHIIAPPTFLFFNSLGQALPHLTLVGEISTENLLTQIQEVKKQ